MVHRTLRLPFAVNPFAVNSFECWLMPVTATHFMAVQLEADEQSALTGSSLQTLPGAGCRSGRLRR